jgi:hypothetical protein
LREDDAMALVIEVDHFEPKVLVDELVEVSDGLAADLRGWDESAHSKVDQHAAFDDLRDGRFDHFVAIVRLDDLLPRFERAGSALGEKERSVHLVDAVNHHFDGIADLEQFGINGERQLAERKYAFGLSTDVDQHFILVSLDDRTGENLSLVENFERLFVQALFERQLIFFFGNGSNVRY